MMKLKSKLSQLSRCCELPSNSRLWRAPTELYTLLAGYFILSAPFYFWQLADEEDEEISERIVKEVIQDNAREVSEHKNVRKHK